VIYADTSFIVASRFRFDTWHNEATAFYAEHEESVWLWSPWHNVEVYHALRQCARENDPRRGLTTVEAKQLIRRLETDVRLGYFQHLESDWRDVLRTAREQSVEYGFQVPFSSADLLHVAYATELAAELFVSFDDDQLALASAVGLTTADPRKED
jgi:predicted nucleic acid-binding protein